MDNYLILQNFCQVRETDKAQTKLLWYDNNRVWSGAMERVLIVVINDVCLWYDGTAFVSRNNGETPERNNV